MYQLALPLLIGLIVVALAFDFLNGLHDAANSIATVVGTRLLSPAMAVAFAAFFNFAAYFLALQWPSLNKTLIAIVLSPRVGLILTMAIMLATSWGGTRASARGAERTFRGLHLVSAGAYSLGHGLNDAQKTMGVITVLLYSTGYLHGDFAVPHWVALSCYVAIGLGTLTGGWRIIETMGTRITKLDQHQGFSASAGGSVMLFAASYYGIPVSTTHTITGCVIGAGAARRASAVRWGIARNVM